MKITIYTSKSGTRSHNVEHSDAASHIAAGGAFAAESQILLAFIKASAVPKTLKDEDGDTWVLKYEGTKGTEDFYVYEIK